MDKQKKWILREDRGSEAEAAIAALAKELGILPTTARVLHGRGYRTAETAREFLSPEEGEWHDPYLLRDMAKAVDRIRRAVKDGEKIVIYGDYDVDGVTSVSLVYLYLRSLGAEVDYYIPCREREGYGVSVSAVEKLAAEGAGLMVTVDTGVTAVTEVAHAKALGIDTVVTDHHECQPNLPQAVAVVNPRRQDCTYPFAELAGVGVALKLVTALEMAYAADRGEEPKAAEVRILDRYADLAALGTIADVMPVVGENRLIIRYGLGRMQIACRKGLDALIRASAGGSGSGTREKPRKIHSGFVGFGIAPRINAAGRIDHAGKAVRLLLAETDREADDLAEELCEINRRRQAEENRIAEEAYRRIERQKSRDGKLSGVLVLEDDHWTHGIIGIVASRLTDRYGLPSILISFDGSVSEEGQSPEDLGKGSGRSIPGVNLVDALTDSSDLLERFGGHELAAGLTVCRKNIPLLRERLNAYAEHCLEGKEPEIPLEADCSVVAGELTMKLAEELERLEPFGTHNPIPQFLLTGAKVLRVQAMSGGKHTKLSVEKDGEIFSAVWFGKQTAALPFAEGTTVDLIFQLSINEYLGTRSLQLLVQDARDSLEQLSEYETEKQRYREIASGDCFLKEELILPAREDFVAVYTLLRREFRGGKRVFHQRNLLYDVRKNGAGDMNYARLKYVLQIMNELRICSVRETAEDEYLVEIFVTGEKAVIDNSVILRTLREKCKNCAG